jgi:hypothetical protein
MLSRQPGDPEPMSWAAPHGHGRKRNRCDQHRSLPAIGRLRLIPRGRQHQSRLLILKPMRFSERRLGAHAQPLRSGMMGNLAKKRACPLILRLREKRLRLADFHDLALIHENNPIRNLACKPHLMGHNQHGHTLTR